jgi:hypothetical protein
MKRPDRTPALAPRAMTELSPDDAANAAQIATWPGDRPGLIRLLQCRLLHRADWQHLGTSQDEPAVAWPVDAYRCDRCDRVWNTVTERRL